VQPSDPICHAVRATLGAAHQGYVPSTPTSCGLRCARFWLGRPSRAGYGSQIPVYGPQRRLWPAARPAVAGLWSTARPHRYGLHRQSLFRGTVPLAVADGCSQQPTSALGMCLHRRLMTWTWIGLARALRVSRASCSPPSSGIPLRTWPMNRCRRRKGLQRCNPAQWLRLPTPLSSTYATRHHSKAHGTQLNGVSANRYQLQLDIRAPSSYAAV